jgi:hypothetical protein
VIIAINLGKKMKDKRERDSSYSPKNVNLCNLTGVAGRQHRLTYALSQGR